MDTSLFDTGDDASTSSIHFVNSNGLPFALDIPDSATPLSDPNLSVYPSEGTSIALAYPELSDKSLAANGGSPPADWFNHPDEVVLVLAGPRTIERALRRYRNGSIARHGQSAPQRATDDITAC